VHEEEVRGREEDVVEREEKVRGSEEKKKWEISYDNENREMLND
jgi:predicted transglutaminase-like protease